MSPQSRGREVRIDLDDDAVAALRDPSWNTLPAGTGSVFHLGEFLLAWWSYRQRPGPAGHLVVVRVRDDAGEIGQCAFELADGVLAFAGGFDVVDYLGPVAASGREKDLAAALTDVIVDELRWHTARLGGLGADDPAARCLLDELSRRTGATVAVADSTPRIDAPREPYLSRLSAKRRADVLRKRRRLEQAVGAVEIVASTGEDWAPALAGLLDWKAMAGPETQAFVQEYGDFLTEMIGALQPLEAASVVELRAEGGPVAAAIVLRHRHTRLLYNMSYDQALAAAGSPGLAPGVVLVSHLAEQTVDAGGDFDFLKGAQDYKLRLGGVPVDLLEARIQR